MKRVITIIAITISTGLTAQMKTDNFKEIGTKYIKTFFEKFNNADSTVLDFFTQKCIMTSTGAQGFQHSDPSTLIRELSKLKGRYKEEISNISITGDLWTMVVSMDYIFYFDGKKHHCGKNFFTLSKNIQKPMTYQIVSLSDSRDGCNASKIVSDTLENRLDRKMLAWHKAAGEANYNDYFEPMDSNFIYLGTDPSERWTKSEFSEFCKPYFSKGKGWDFKTKWRNWYSSEDGNVFWFEELLDTHMGECRGSGVWKFTDGEWKILHYNLALTIFNEKMEEVKKVNKK